MSKPSDSGESRDALRRKVLGFGETSHRKSYYPTLRHRIRELERLRILLDHSSDAMLWAEVPSGRLVDLNAAARKFLHIPSDEVPDLLLSNIFPAFDSRVLEKDVAAESTSDSVSGAEEDSPAILETDMISPDAAVIPVEVTFGLHRLQGTRFAMVVARDITKRKKAREELRGLATAIEHAAEAVIITDPDGIVQYVNPAFERISGYSRAETVGHPPRFLRDDHQDRGFSNNLRATLARGEIWTGRFSNPKKDGGNIEAETTISPIRDAAGRLSGYVAIVRDVTEQAQLELQLRQVQKMEAVGQLAGGVAHDFNNLLQVIQGYGEIARIKMDPQEPSHTFLDQIMKAAERGKSLVRQLLAFSRRETLNPEYLDLNTLLRDLTCMLRRVIGEHIELVLMPQPDLHAVYADAGQMEQILINLCVNARDAMDKGGGRITLETRNVRPESGFLHRYPWTSPGDYVRLSVSDTGYGIPPEIRERIFEPFFTTKGLGEGTGLGLATVYAIIKHQAGMIDVDSTPGEGTRFHLYFPAAARPSVAEPARESVPDSPGGRETILLAEDDQLVRELTHLILEKAGYRVVAVRDGQEAIDRLRADPKGFDLALLDLVMPRKSGRAVYRVIQAEKWKVPVLFCTGYSFDALGSDRITEDPVRVIRKPFTPNELRRTVREILTQETTPRSD